MRAYELPKINIRRFSIELVMDKSAKSAWDQAVADAQGQANTKGTVSIKLERTN